MSLSIFFHVLSSHSGVGLSIRGDMTIPPRKYHSFTFLCFHIKKYYFSHFIKSIPLWLEHYIRQEIDFPKHEFYFSTWFLIGNDFSNQKDSELKIFNSGSKLIFQNMNSIIPLGSPFHYEWNIAFWSEMILPTRKTVNQELNANQKSITLWMEYYIPDGRTYHSRWKAISLWMQCWILIGNWLFHHKNSNCPTKSPCHDWNIDFQLELIFHKGILIFQPEVHSIVNGLLNSNKKLMFFFFCWDLMALCFHLP